MGANPPVAGVLEVEDTKGLCRRCSGFRLCFGRARGQGEAKSLAAPCGIQSLWGEVGSGATPAPSHCEILSWDQLACVVSVLAFISEGWRIV